MCKYNKIENYEQLHENDEIILGLEALGVFIDFKSNLGILNNTLDANYLFNKQPGYTILK